MASLEPGANLDLGPGHRLGRRYVLEGLLDEGGMGKVYRAHQEPFGRTVAIKVLRAEQAQLASVRERFLREAEIVSRLAHPNTVTVLDFGETESGRLYLVMELVEGRPLSHVIAEQGTLALEDAVAFTVQIAQSLGEAHHKNIIHRDLKPDNVMVCDLGSGDPYIKVLDFGIARIVEEELGGTDTDLGGGFAKRVVAGTPPYMSPEQAEGRDVDGRSDLYALACCLFEMLSGRPPYRGNSPMSVLVQHLGSAVPDLPARVPGSINRFLKVALAKAPPERPRDASAFVAALMGCFREPAPDSARHLTPDLRPSSLSRHLRTPRSGPPVSTLQPDPAETRPTRTLLFSSASDDHDTATSGDNLSKTHVAALPFSNAPPAEGGDDGHLEDEAADAGPMWRPLFPDVAEQAEADSAEPPVAAVETRDVVLDSHALGALVFVDDLCIGTTPLTYRAPVGQELRVSFVRTGFESPPPVSLVVAADRDNRLFGNLQARLLTFTVVSPVGGAQLLVQGRDYGWLSEQRPRNIRLTWPQEPLELRLRHPLYQDHVTIWPAEALETPLHHAPTLDELVPREG